MIFEVGQVWKTRGGFEVEIKSTSYPNEQFPIFGVRRNRGGIEDRFASREAGRSFSLDGLNSLDVQSPYDLMTLVSNEDANVVASETSLGFVPEDDEVTEDERTVTESPVDPIRQYFLDSLVMKAFEQALKTEKSIGYYRNDIYDAIALRDALK